MHVQWDFVAQLVARLTPDQKVACSNHAEVTAMVFVSNYLLYHFRVCINNNISLTRTTYLISPRNILKFCVKSVDSAFVDSSEMGLDFLRNAESRSGIVQILSSIKIDHTVEI